MSPPFAGKSSDNEEEKLLMKWLRGLRRHSHLEGDAMTIFLKNEIHSNQCVCRSD